MFSHQLKRYLPILSSYSNHSALPHSNGSAFVIPTSTFRIPNSEFHIPNSELQIPHSAIQIPHSEHSELRIPQSNFRIRSGNRILTLITTVVIPIL